MLSDATQEEEQDLGQGLVRRRQRVDERDQLLDEALRRRVGLALGRHAKDRRARSTFVLTLLERSYDTRDPSEIGRAHV